MKFIKSLILTALMAVMATFTTFAQSAGTGVAQSAAKYYAVPITLPFTTLAGGSINTNLGLGWSVVTAVTNITQVFTNSPSGVGFYPSFLTNIAYVTNTTYAQFYAASGQRYVPIHFAITNANATATSNLVIGVSYSVPGTAGSYKVQQLYTNAWPATASANVDFIVDMQGYVNGQISSIAWLDATAGDILTFQASQYASNPNIR